MSIYKVYDVKNGESLFTSFNKKQDKIVHSKIKDFRIQKTLTGIRISGKEYLKSILSTESNEIIDEVRFEMLIARHQRIYCIIGLEGRGLLTIHGYSKYIKDNLITSVENYFKETTKIDLKIVPFKYDNNNFSKSYWGENVTTEMSYYSSDRLYIKISCSNFYTFIQKNQELNKYFSNGTIKSIKGHLPEFDYKENETVRLGSFKFDRQGQFHLNFFDIDFFNNFVKTMIDEDFFRSEE